MKRFEYRVESFQASHGGHNPTPSAVEVLERINALGAEGWEFCVVVSGGLCLKREVAE